MVLLLHLQASSGCEVYVQDYEYLDSHFTVYTLVSATLVTSLTNRLCQTIPAKDHTELIQVQLLPCAKGGGLSVPQPV